MNTRNNHRTYRAIFDNWNNNRTPLKFRDKIIYKPAADEIFRPCYLPASCKDERFYKARHNLPKHWFVSNLGTIITVKRGKAELIIGQFTDYDRMQVSMYYRQEKFTICRESIVALVFNDTVECTAAAAELIEEKGLEAFRRRTDFKCIELHHKNGYIHPAEPMNVTQIFENLPENSKSDAIQLITRLEHFKIHHPLAA